MKKHFLLRSVLVIFFLSTTVPIDVYAEKMTRREKREWLKELEQCPSNMYEKAQIDFPRLFQSWTVKLNKLRIRNHEEFLKSSFTVYCECLKNIAFINLDKERILNYAKNECGTQMNNLTKKNLEAEKYLQKELGIERYQQYLQPRNSTKYNKEERCKKRLQVYGLTPQDLGDNFQKTCRKLLKIR